MRTPLPWAWTAALLVLSSPVVMALTAEIQTATLPAVDIESRWPATAADGGLPRLVDFTSFDPPQGMPLPFTHGKAIYTIQYGVTVYDSLPRKAYRIIGKAQVPPMSLPSLQLSRACAIAIEHDGNALLPATRADLEQNKITASHETRDSEEGFYAWILRQAP